MALSQKLVALGAGSVIALAAMAQVVIPPCCNYLWDWPSEENPNGACAGKEATSCQTGSQNVWGEDPMARDKFPITYIQAQCFSVVLGENADFLRQDCADDPPAGGYFIGVLPNGQCCYAVGYGPDIDIESYNAGYLIKQCEGACDEYES